MLAWPHVSQPGCHIEFAQSPRDDLRDILDWYASQDVPQVGRRIVAVEYHRQRPGYWGTRG
ncbi:MAG: hypothetical protein GXX83_00500 [Gaiellales bacterium]|nr:hypothetical protein [Gaiellales bacterium]